MVRPVSLQGFQGVSDFPQEIMCLYQIPQLRGEYREKIMRINVGAFVIQRIVL